MRGLRAAEPAAAFLLTSVRAELSIKFGPPCCRNVFLSRWPRTVQFAVGGSVPALIGLRGPREVRGNRRREFSPSSSALPGGRFIAAQNQTPNGDAGCRNTCEAGISPLRPGPSLHISNANLHEVGQLFPTIFLGCWIMPQSRLELLAQRKIPFGTTAPTPRRNFE